LGKGPTLALRRGSGQTAMEGAKTRDLNRKAVGRTGKGSRFGHIRADLDRTERERGPTSGGRCGSRRWASLPIGLIYRIGRPFSAAHSGPLLLAIQIRDRRRPRMTSRPAGVPCR
jgi:hypothetical protein